MNATHLAGGVAQCAGPLASGGAKTGLQLAIDDKWLQRAGERGRISRWYEYTARDIDDFGGPTHPARHHGQAGLHRFDERQPERLGRGVRLTEHIRRIQQRRHVSALAEKPDTIGDAGLLRHRLELLSIGRFMRTLNSTDDPARPARHISKQ